MPVFLAKPGVGTYTNSYDCYRGLQTSVSNPHNQVRTTNYDGVNRVVSVVEGSSRTTTYSYNELFNVYFRGNPSSFDGDTRGFINGGMGTIPGASFAETMGHELLGHTWGQLFGGNPAGTKGNLRQSVLGEDAVRRTDPARGLKTTHTGIEVITQSDVDRLRRK